MYASWYYNISYQHKDQAENSEKTIVSGNTLRDLAMQGTGVYFRGMTPGDSPGTRIPTQNIPPSRIDPDAMKVVRRLRRFGHVAYLVGGCVRDLMLRKDPKDFDVATSARPQEIRKLFRNCRLIGRRFRLAHIHFRGKVIETATFRAAAGEQVDGDILIRSDNVFGSEQEDASRRDFTVNALFYDPVERVVIDHVGGLEDLVERRIRFIGKSDVRVREDPVRILRAIKFAARLNFTIDPDAWRAMMRHRKDLVKCAPPRLLEEIVRMLRGGGAEPSFRLMWEAGVLEIIMPEVARYLQRAPERDEEREPGTGLFAFLREVDRSDRDLLTNAVLLACVIIHPVVDAAKNGGSGYDVKVTPAAGEVAREMLRRMVERVRLPKWQAERIQQLVASQKRLFHLRRNAPLPRGLIQRSYFPEALDLFEVGVKATGKGRPALNRLRQASSQMARQEGGPIPSSTGSQPRRKNSRGRSRRRGGQKRRRRKN
jgi:poly(A) polymerase